jgi:predicted metal-dependent hydrolase
LRRTIAGVVAEPVPTLPPYTIRRSARARRSRLTLTDTGDVVVVLPTRAAQREADYLVGRHTTWIDWQQKRLAARRAALASRPTLAVGRLLSVGGINRVVRVGNERERAALERRLRREAWEAITARVAALGPIVGVTVRGIMVRDQRTRWGSASRTGTLSFNWRLILCPPSVLEYVVVHELAHLRLAGHSTRFWALVERHFGDPRPARRWLREHHDEILHALD